MKSLDSGSRVKVVVEQLVDEQQPAESGRGEICEDVVPDLRWELD